MIKVEYLRRSILETVKNQLSITAIAAIVALSLSILQLLDIFGRNKQVAFHNQVAFELLEHGYYERAKRAFEEALKLDSGNAFAINGLLVSEMFLGFEEADWEPSVGWLMDKNLQTLGLGKKFNHILLKYNGDAEQAVGNMEKARDKFNEAIKLSPNYVDALYRDGWAAYEQRPTPSIDGMLERFKKMTITAPYDYRGYHGYGYALYMQAVRSKPHSEERQELLACAAEQSKQATKFQVNYLNIVVDFGEIARAAAPRTSLFYHQLAENIIEEPQLSELKGNKRPLVIRALQEGSERNVVYLNTRDEREAWLYYQLSLDYLSLFIKSNKTQEIYEKAQEYRTKAASLDHGRNVIKIYEDQKIILKESVQPGPEVAARPCPVR